MKASPMSDGMYAISDLFADASLIQHLTNKEHPISRLVSAFEQLLLDATQEREHAMLEHIVHHDGLTKESWRGKKTISRVRPCRSVKELMA